MFDALIFAAGLGAGAILTVAGILVWAEWSVRREREQSRRAARAGRLAVIPLTDDMLLSLLRLPPESQIVSVADHRTQARLALIVEHPRLPPIALHAVIPEVRVVAAGDSSALRVPRPSEN